MAKRLKKITRKILKSPLAVSIISEILYWYSKLVGCTTSWSKHNITEFNQDWNNNKAIILIIWHGRAAMIPYFWNSKHPMNALVSLHNDGKFMGEFLRRYGVGIIGGSTTVNSRSAAVNLMKTLKKEESICIIPDGPIGPSMKMTMSPLYFAQKSGKPIIGIAYSVKHAKIFDKSWDDMMFPYPFGKGVLAATKPYFIPENATDEELEAYRLQIENDMNTININADIELGRQPTLPGKQFKNRRNNIKED